VWLDWGRKRDGSIIEKQVAAIGLKDILKDVHIIHGLTSFVLGEDSRWRTKKYNTQRKHVHNIIQFLNYLIKNRRKLKINKLSDITIQIGTDFLSHLSFRNHGVAIEDSIIEKDITIDRATVLSISKTLTYFYIWLKNNEMLPYVDEELLQEFKRKNHHNGEALIMLFRENLRTGHPLGSNLTGYLTLYIALNAVYRGCLPSL